VFEQTHKDIEYIFVNDCTLDNSITVLEQVITKHYPEKRNRIKIINKGKNEGLPMARKTGLAYAAGDYVLHVDSDDWLEPDMIGKLYAKAMIDDCDIVYCDFIRFAAPPIAVEQFSNTDCTAMRREEILKAVLSYRVPWNVWNKLVKRDLFDGVVFPEYQNGEDLCLCIQLMYRARKIGYVPETLYHWRVNRESISFNDKANTVRLLEVYNNLKMTRKFLEDKYGERVVLLEPELSEVINAKRLLIIKTSPAQLFRIGFQVKEARFFRWILRKIVAKLKMLVKK